MRRGSRYSDSPEEDTRRLLESPDEPYDGDDDDDNADEETRLTSRESITNERPDKVCASL